MTREDTIEAIKVMQDYVDGKEVEFIPKDNVTNQEWESVTPDFD